MYRNYIKMSEIRAIQCIKMSRHGDWFQKTNKQRKWSWKKFRYIEDMYESRVGFYSKKYNLFRYFDDFYEALMIRNGRLYMKPVLVILFKDGNNVHVHFNTDEATANYASVLMTFVNDYLSSGNDRMFCLEDIEVDSFNTLDKYIYSK